MVVVMVCSRTGSSAVVASGGGTDGDHERRGPKGKEQAQEGRLICFALFCVTRREGPFSWVCFSPHLGRGGLVHRCFSWYGVGNLSLTSSLSGHFEAYVKRPSPIRSGVSFRVT